MAWVEVRALMLGTFQIPWPEACFVAHHDTFHNSSQVSPTSETHCTSLVAARPERVLALARVWKGLGLKQQGQASRKSMDIVSYNMIPHVNAANNMNQKLGWAHVCNLYLWVLLTQHVFQILWWIIIAMCQPNTCHDLIVKVSNKVTSPCEVQRPCASCPDAIRKFSGGGWRPNGSYRAGSKLEGLLGLRRSFQSLRQTTRPR